MFTSTAEMAAGERIPRSITETSFLGRVKQRLDFDPEQQNSLFKFFGRLVNRQSDIENDAVMAAFLRRKTWRRIFSWWLWKKKNITNRTGAR
jgi:hypothetical protein